jgi:lipoprotein-anchoring transpeptidase ErfK/SrfK
MLVARIRPGRVVPVRTAPSGPVVARLSARTEFGSPQTLAVAQSTARRLAVVTTALPNGRVGWVDARPGIFRFAHTRVSLEIDLSRRELRVHEGARIVRRMPVGIGAPGTPTPIGRFAVTDELNGARYSPVYGCCILALSGHQTNLPSGWTGGDRLAIHGGSTAGAVSTGCLHASAADLAYLMRTVPLGAQVLIHP